MSGLCLGLALSLVQAVLPTDSVVLSWQHSVEKVRWTEHYVLKAGQLVLSEATLQGSGAGMEPPSDAVFDGTVWRYRPAVAPLPKVALTRSTFTDDYRLCWHGSCHTLTALVGPLRTEGETIDLFPCPGDVAPSPPNA